MRRLADWAERLNAYLEACENKPFQWGQHDCVQFACGAVEAMTGERPLPQLCGHYTTAREAARSIAAYGENLEAAVTAQCRQLGFVEISPLRAQRGDVVLLATDSGDDLSIPERGALGIIGMNGLPVFVDTHELLEVPLEVVRRAWKICPEASGLPHYTSTT